MHNECTCVIAIAVKRRTRLQWALSYTNASSTSAEGYGQVSKVAHPLRRKLRILALIFSPAKTMG
jgi:hypothetical protein